MPRGRKKKINQEFERAANITADLIGETVIPDKPYSDAELIDDYENELRELAAFIASIGEGVLAYSVEQEHRIIADACRGRANRIKELLED